MKISFSGKEKYAQCSMMYKLHYIDKIRPERIGSALVFGSALDNALNHLLEHKDLEQAKSIFWMDWAEYEHNPIIDYYKSDLDMDLLSMQESQELDEIQDDKLREHRANWLSMFYKGNKLLESYYEELLPRIKKVISIQKEISLQGMSDDGTPTDDTITGIIDLEADVELDNGEVVRAILDNKSTSTPYPQNSYMTKHQTALYTFAEGIKYAGFLTMNKKNFATQCIVGEVPAELQEEVLQEFAQTIENIKSEKFKKQPKKKCFAFGKRCDYYGYCWDDSTEGLYIKKEE